MSKVNSDELDKHQFLAKLREMLAEFADEPYRQREYRIIEFVQAHINNRVREALQDVDNVFKQGSKTLRGGDQTEEEWVTLNPVEYLEYRINQLKEEQADE